MECGYDRSPNHLWGVNKLSFNGAVSLSLGPCVVCSQEKIISFLESLGDVLPGLGQGRDLVAY